MSKCGMNHLELLPERCRDRDVDFFREGLHVLVEGIMDAEVSAQIGARHGERNPTTHPPERLPQPRLGHPGGDNRVEDT